MNSAAERDFYRFGCRHILYALCLLWLLFCPRMEPGSARLAADFGHAKLRYRPSASFPASTRQVLLSFATRLPFLSTISASA
jgi:hypothetical protein